MKVKLRYYLSKFFKDFLFYNTFLTLQFWHIFLQVVFFSSIRQGTFTIFKFWLRMFTFLIPGHFEIEIWKENDIRRNYICYRWQFIKAKWGKEGYVISWDNKNPYVDVNEKKISSIILPKTINEVKIISPED